MYVIDRSSRFEDSRKFRVGNRSERVGVEMVEREKIERKKEGELLLN